jgi:hypothetical protein
VLPQLEVEQHSLIKPNQIGRLNETGAAVDLAYKQTGGNRFILLSRNGRAVFAIAHDRSFAWEISYKRRESSYSFPPL